MIIKLHGGFIVALAVGYNGNHGGSTEASLQSRFRQGFGVLLGTRLLPPKCRCSREARKLYGGYKLPVAVVPGKTLACGQV